MSVADWYVNTMSIVLDDIFELTPGLLFVADAGGQLLHQSKALTDRFGSHTNVAAWVGADGRAAVEAFLAELGRSDQTVTRVLQLSAVDGQQALRPLCRTSSA